MEYCGQSRHQDQAVSNTKNSGFQFLASARHHNIGKDMQKCTSMDPILKKYIKVYVKSMGVSPSNGIRKKR